MQTDPALTDQELRLTSIFQQQKSYQHYRINIMGEETKTDQNDDASRSNQEESSSHHAHLQQQTGSSGVPTIP